MKRLNFDWLMLLLSFVLSLAGALVCLNFKDTAIETVWGTIAWSAAYFAVPLLCSLIGIAVAEFIRSRRYVLQKKGNRAVSMIAAVLIAVLIGGGGQALYMIDIVKTGTPEPAQATEPPKPSHAPVTKKDDGVNVALLLDNSGSMEEVSSTCKDTACELVDKLDENTYLDFILFSNTIFQNTGLTPLDDDGKEIIKNIIKTYPWPMGTTRFNDPLSEASDALTGSGAEGRPGSVIVITDGKDTSGAEIEEHVTDSFIQNNIPVYLISIETDDDGDGTKDGISSVVKKTDGFEIELDKNKFDSDKLLSALHSAYNRQNPEETEKPEEDAKPDKKHKAGYKLSVKMGDGLLPFGNEGLGIIKFIIRMIMLILYGILATRMIYYSISLRSVIICIVTGAVAALLASLIDDYYMAAMVLASVMYALLFWSAFTMYYPARGGLEDV